MKKFRVRCAPSPSGTIHLGNAKTFLFNYLFSQKYDADFILRIEDTDTSRVVDQGAEKLLAELKWLGLAPTMGWGTNNCPAGSYNQMGRLNTYKKYADELINKGLAYKCYCTEQELTAAREKALVDDPKNPYRYPGTCRDARESDKPYVIRFKAPTEGYTSFDDLAFGKKSVPNKENYDFVIFRQNGIPLFNFANCIDDLAIDNITHVIRGSDHLKNTPQQVMLTDALGFARPQYCHLPMLLNGAGGKLSKRDGSVSVADYRKAGYTPAAVLNYLVRFGWGHKNQEVFSMSELISLFDIKDCGKNDGKFDAKKFAAIQFEHLKSSALTPDDEYVVRVIPFLAELGCTANDKDIRALLPLIRPRAKTFVEAATQMLPFLMDIIHAPFKLQESILASIPINSLIDSFAEVQDWNSNNLRSVASSWLAQQRLLLRDVGAFCRLALLGSPNSPELFDVMVALGKDRAISRLKAATFLLITPPLTNTGIMAKLEATTL